MSERWDDIPRRTIYRKPKVDRTPKRTAEKRQAAIAAQQYACAACRTPNDGNLHGLYKDGVVLGYMCHSCHSVFSRFIKSNSEDIAADYLWSMGDWADANLSV